MNYDNIIKINLHLRKRDSKNVKCEMLTPINPSSLLTYINANKEVLVQSHDREGTQSHGEAEEGELVECAIGVVVALVVQLAGVLALVLADREESEHGDAHHHHAAGCLQC